MSRINNYYWWSPEKWREVLRAGEQYWSADIVADRMKNMTHHERRLYIRKILEEELIARVINKRVKRVPLDSST